MYNAHPVSSFIVVSFSPETPRKTNVILPKASPLPACSDLF